jgi:hypothetical protein
MDELDDLDRDDSFVAGHTPPYGRPDEWAASGMLATWAG